MYKYDLHVHTSACSCCGVSTPEEQVKAYSEKGYSGIVITDHFICGFNGTPIPRELAWKERIDRYYTAYERAAKAAEQYEGFKAFFGAEYSYAGGHDILFYGLHKEFLYEHPEIEGMPVEDMCKLLQSAGCLVVQAHPFRDRGYNDNSVQPELYCADGAEIFNSCNSDEENQKALEFALKNHKIMTSGGDIHNAGDERIGLSGIFTENPIESIDDLVGILKSGKYSLCVKGEIKI
ncbi:MAG: PHP domain-containing protein [Acutalibacteraceae bacterium]